MSINGDDVGGCHACSAAGDKLYNKRTTNWSLTA